jgi:thioesterase domain-containing protein
MAQQLRAAGEEVALLALCHVTAFDFPALVSPLAHLRYRAHEALRDVANVTTRLSHHGRQLLTAPGSRLPHLKNVIGRGYRRMTAHTRELRIPAFVPIGQQAFDAYVPRSYSDDVLLVLNEAQTRAYTRDPEASWRGLTGGRITVHLVKRGGSEQFDDSEMSEVGAVLRRQLARTERRPHRRVERAPRARLE